MSNPIPSEIIQYERFADDLRRNSNLTRIALQKLIAASDDLIAAIDGTTDQFQEETAALSQAVSEAERLLEGGAT